MHQVSVPVYFNPMGQVLGDFGNEREGASRAVVRILLKQVEERG